jgi:diguanylate cyclase (GGDEF)-like protein/PAS domain S-box-containing protein
VTSPTPFALVAPPPKPGNDWFDSLAASTAAAVLVSDGERVLYANPAAERLTGLPLARLCAGSPFDPIHPDDRDAARQRMAARLDGQAVEATVTLRLCRPDGEVIWAELTGGLVDLGDGRTGVAFSAFDVTERKRVELALERERDHAHVTLAAIGDGVVRTDAAGRIETMNPVAERLVGRSLGEVAGVPLDEVYHRVDQTTAKPLASTLALCLAQRRPVESPQHCLLVGRDGEELVVQESAAPVFDRDGALAGAVLVVRDVTRLTGMEREISYFASHDAVTGLLHRRELERRLARHLEAGGGRGGALIHLDVDEFRVVNDLCGHNAGDELLREVAERLYETVGEAGVVARMGADEFGVLLPRATPEEGRRRAEELRAAVADHRFRWRDHLFDVRVSVGVVPLGAAGGDLPQVIIAAEAAALAAKERGRDRVQEYRPHDRELVERHGEMQWIHRIHRAFEEDLFCLHRQPIRPLTEDGEEGLSEVLIRMRGDDGRLVAPGAFIPAAERYHLIPAIDRWVVRTVLAGLAAGGDGNGHGCLAVNVSGLSLSDERFLDDVVAALDASGVDPRRLCFEITETAAVAHLARAHRFMAVLRAQGCRFVLDDFGSGLSSFAYLKNLPVDFLKISSQFVRGLEDTELQRALVGSIHQIGDLMRMGTIAEGVETAAALEALEELGVHYAQGFWIGRPEPL